MIKIRCEGCDIKLGGLILASTQNPNRCEDCLTMENRVATQCLCGRDIFSRNPIEYYKKHGNLCMICIDQVNQMGRQRIKHRE